MNNNNELYHFGILGQKWGLRRYQNEDGTLTEEGKKRYYKEGKIDKELMKYDIQKAEEKRTKVYDKLQTMKDKTERSVRAREEFTRPGIINWRKFVNLGTLGIYDFSTNLLTKHRLNSVMRLANKYDFQENTLYRDEAKNFIDRYRLTRVTKGLNYGGF